MLREITIGQYYPSNSILHKLDARVKIIATVLFMITLFVFNSWIGFLLSAVFLCAIICLSKIPFSYILKGIKPLIVLLLITVLFNVFLVDGEVLFKVWIFRVTKEGLFNAIKMALRLIFLILGSSLLTFTTTPNNLTDALESLFKPLKYIKVPVHEMAMMMSIALRFIPILLEETDKIMKAQLARGADFESGNLITKVKSLLPILIPLFVSAFRRAVDLAMAMEARCYRGGNGRTKMKPLKYGASDFIAFLVLILYLVLHVLISIIT